jgi:hypothetical protein
MGFVKVAPENGSRLANSTTLNCQIVFQRLLDLTVVLQVCDNQQPWLVMLEILPPDIPTLTLPPFDKDHDVMLFFKFYCPRTRKVRAQCFLQCWGTVTFWCGSGSPDPYLSLMDPVPNLDPTPDPTPFFNDFKDVNKIVFFLFFSYNLPTGTSSSVLKIYFFC